VSIFLNERSKVIVQGITGGEGTKHSTKMLAAGTNIVGGVNARKAGSKVAIGGKDLTVFGTVEEAMKETGADVSVVFVPPKFAKDAVIEAIDAEIPLVVVITEGIPVHDSAYFWAHASAKGNKTRIIGPNCPGIISPGKSNAGIIPADIAGPGKIGLVSKSGTLTYQMMYELREIGFSSAIGIGGDPIIGTTHIDALEAFEADPETAAIVMIGEIGGPRRRHRVRLGGHRAGQEGSAGGGRCEGRQDPQRDRGAHASDHRRTLNLVPFPTSGAPSAVPRRGTTFH
jgi:succinyl-CoA synthetase alpha subunit